MPSFIQRIIEKIIFIFNIIVIRQIDDKHVLYLIPKITEKKIRIILKKNKKNKIIFSTALREYEHYLENRNQSNKIEYYYILDILEYIMNKTEKQLSEQNITILANNYNINNIKTVYLLINKVKSLKIVTSNIKKYNGLEEKIFEEKRDINNNIKQQKESVKRCTDYNKFRF